MLKLDTVGLDLNSAFEWMKISEQCGCTGFEIDYFDKEGKKIPRSFNCQGFFTALQKGVGIYDRPFPIYEENSINMGRSQGDQYFAAYLAAKSLQLSEERTIIAPDNDPEIYSIIAALDEKQTRSSNKFKYVKIENRKRTQYSLTAFGKQAFLELEYKGISVRSDAKNAIHSIYNLGRLTSEKRASAFQIEDYWIYEQKTGANVALIITFEIISAIKETKALSKQEIIQILLSAIIEVYPYIHEIPDIQWKLRATHILMRGMRRWITENILAYTKALKEKWPDCKSKEIQCEATLWTKKILTDTALTAVEGMLLGTNVHNITEQYGKLCSTKPIFWIPSLDVYYDKICTYFQIKNDEKQVYKALCNDYYTRIKDNFCLCGYAPLLSFGIHELTVFSEEKSDVSAFEDRVKRILSSKKFNDKSQIDTVYIEVHKALLNVIDAIRRRTCQEPTARIKFVPKRDTPPALHPRMVKQ